MYHNCVKFIDTYTFKHHLLDSSLADQQNNERHYLDNIVLCCTVCSIVCAAGENKRASNNNVRAEKQLIFPFFENRTK